MMLWLSAIGLFLLLTAVGYFAYGEPGAVTVSSAICVIVFAIWINHTA